MRTMLLFCLLSMLMVVSVDADPNFEDSRCRCVCPSTAFFTGETKNNDTVDKNNKEDRRYYTMTNVNPSDCNPSHVVKPAVQKIVISLDAFLNNCDCRHESRNTVMLKVVVIFVICVIAILATYMMFLMFLDPVIRRKKFAIPYRSQNDEMEDNIFARASESASGSDQSVDDVSIQPSTSTNTRPRNNVLGRVEAEKNRWMKKVEEQRKNIFQNHSMLN